MGPPVDMVRLCLRIPALPDTINWAFLQAAGIMWIEITFGSPRVASCLSGRTDSGAWCLVRRSGYRVPALRSSGSRTGGPCAGGRDGIPGWLCISG